METSTIDNLQNYSLGSSRGKSRLLRRLLRSLAQSFVGEMTSGCTRAQSFLPKLQLSVWFFLDLSLVPCYDAEWRTTSLCWVYESASKEHISSRPDFSFRAPMLGIRAHISREPCRVGNRFAIAHVFPNSALTSHILFPVTRETLSRSLIKDWRCSAFSRATMHVLSI